MSRPSQRAGTASSNDAPISLAIQLQPSGVAYNHCVGSAIQYPNSYTGPVQLSTYQVPSYGQISGGISAYTSSKLTLTGLNSLTSTVVGAYVTIVGAANAGNNGSFLITDFISSTSVKVLNTTGVYPDANSGNLEMFVDAFTYNFDVQIKGNGGSQPSISFNGEYQFIIQQYRPNHRLFL